MARLAKARATPGAFPTERAADDAAKKPCQEAAIADYQKICYFLLTKVLRICYKDVVGRPLRLLLKDSVFLSGQL
jgi:hypothetical protein